METSTFTYNGKLWRQSPTTSDENSFFHSAFGVVTDEGGAYFDKKAKFRRRRWATFLTYFESEAIPAILADVLKKCLSANDKHKHATLDDQSGIEDYISGIISAEQAVTVEEIAVIAALENIKIVLLVNERPKPIIINPDKAILGSQSSNEKPKGEVVLRLEGNIFYRLNPVKEDLPSRSPKDAVVKVKGDKLHARHSNTGLLTYKKGGSAGSEGVQYQVGLVTIFFLNALRNLSDWELSAENEAAGKFDDVVLQWPGGATLLQAKHKQSKNKKKKNITFEDLMSVNSKSDDFSLPKYFLSFQEVKQVLSMETVPLKNVVICTNASVDGKAMKLLTPNKIPPDSMLHWEECQCQFYTFKDDILSTLKEKVEIYLEENPRNKNVDESAITDENVKDFLGHLQLFLDYPSGNDVRKVTEHLLLDMKRSKSRYGEMTPLEIHTKMLDWYHQPDGTCLTELHANAIYYEVCRDRIWHVLEKYDVVFIRNLTFPKSTKIFSIYAERGFHLLQELRIFRTLQKDKTTILYAKVDDDIVALNRAVEAFTLPKYTALVIVWIKIAEASVLRQFTGKLSPILEKSSYKKVISVADRSNKLIRLVESCSSNCEIIYETVTFDHLMKESQITLMGRENVLFQGNNVSLEQLLTTQATENYKKFLDSETLEKLVKSEQIKVGAPPSQLSEDVARTYITRKFKKIANTSRYGEPKESTFSEEDICEMTEKVMLISDSAGTGKSTVLSNLAAIIKKRDPQLWVLRVDLNNYTKVLKGCVDKGKEEIHLTELLDSKYSTKFTNHLERSTFSMEGKVVLMLDGFDEIGPDFTELLLGLVSVCLEQHNFAKLFVTTRPHVNRELAAKLQTLPYKLVSFTRENQIGFLANYWSHNLILDDVANENCQRYAEALIRKVSVWIETLQLDQDQFAGIPLQTKMFADIFQERGCFDQATDWETCKDFLYSNEIEPKLPNDMNITRLYEMFVQRKRSIFFEKGNPSGNPFANNALVDQFEECMTFQRKLALELIVGRENCECFASYRQGCRDVEVNTLNIGIVQKVDNELQFLHRTFAEYFTAETIFRELRTGNTDVEFQKLLFEEILQSGGRFNLVCGFLDGFLQEVVDEFPHTAFLEYQKSIYAISRSNVTKIRVFSYLAAEGHVAIFQLLLKSVQVLTEDPAMAIRQHRDSNGVTYCNQFNAALSNFLTEGFDMVRGDMTLLGHAADNNRLPMVKFLVSRGANLDLGIRKPIHLAAKGSRFELFKFLAERGAKLELDYSSWNRTILYKTIKGKQPTIAAYLLDGALKGGELKVRDPNFLYAAAFLGRLDVMEDLIRRGADVDGRVDQGETPIFGAARGGQLEAMRLLDARKCNVNARDARNNTALQMVRRDASQHASTKALVEMGIDVNCRRSDLNTALHTAVACDDYVIVELIVTAAANLHLKDRKGATALHIAASQYRKRIVELLVQRGAPLDARDKCGRTPLHVVTWTDFDLINCYEDCTEKVKDPTYLNDRLDIIRTIVQAGGGVNVADPSHRTALHLAAKTNPVEVVALLVELKADVDARDEDGRTALYLAAAEGQAEVVEFLLRHGIDVNIKDELGQTVVQSLASSGEHADVLKLIVESGKVISNKDKA